MKYNIQINIAPSSAILLLQGLLTPEVGGEGIYIPHMRNIGRQQGEEDEDSADAAKNLKLNILFMCMAITGIVVIAALCALYLCYKFGAFKRDNNENIRNIELQRRRTT